MSGPLSRHLRNLAAYCGVFVLAVVATEGLLQLVLSRSIEMTLWFTPGIHVPDAKYGFRYSPGYTGWMRHADHVFLEPLALDTNGFRRPAVRPDSKQDVVLMGGFSMVFSYGARDDSTIHRALSDALHTPSTVYNTAWPGFDMYRNFHVYRDRLAPDVHPAFTVICFMEETLADFAGLPEDPSVFRCDTSAYKDLFQYFDRHALPLPSGELQRALGRSYYRSYVMRKLGTAGDDLKDLVLATYRDPAAPLLPDTARSMRGAEHLRTWAAYLHRYFGGRGHVLFVTLPRNLDKAHYDPILAQLPAQADVLDLNRTLGDRVRATGFMADRHYTPASDVLIGRHIAACIDSIQGRSTPDVPATAPH